jgi:tRNA-modifying protein YgfZ
VNPSDFPADYEALTGEGGFVQLPAWTQLVMRGKDRSTFLHGMCTNDIRGRSAGQGCEALVTNVQGKTVGYVTLFIADDRIEIVSSPGQADTLQKHWDRYLIREDVTIHDVSSAQSLLIAAGSRVRSQLADPIKAEWRAYEHAATHIGGNSVQFRCLEPSLNIFQIASDSASSAALQQHLVAAGLRPCSYAAYDCLRIELGWPHYGADVSDQNLPQELDRNSQAISLTKGCYLGQETVARIDALGHVNWYLRGLKLPDDPAWEQIEELAVDGKVIARLKSRTSSPQWQSPLALAYVRRGWEQVGKRIAGPAGDAEVVALP